MGIAMRVRQLEVFTAVMRAGTVTAAARMLNISQPALSQVLRHAEDDLGFALFDRKKGRLKPTAEALEIYPEAERIFGSLEGLRRRTADLKLGRTGLVRIACSTPPAMSLLPQVLSEYRKTYPDISVRCNVAPLASLRVMLREGDAAMALGLSDQVGPDIKAEVLRQVSFCCLLPADHPLVQHNEIGFDQLARETIISYHTSSRPFEELDKAARRAGHMFEPQLEIDGALSAVGFVQAGLGVGVVDALLPWQQITGLVTRPLIDSPTVPLALLTLRDKTLSRAEDLMRDQIRAVISAPAS